MDTSRRIIDALNREARSVNELCRELSLSRNSVHLQVNKLEAAGIIRKLPPQRLGEVGKPAHRYRTVGGHEDTFSSAYKPLADKLMQSLGETLSEQSRVDLLQKTGRKMAQAAGLQPEGDLEQDLARAIDAVNGLGAMAELTCDGEDRFIRCFSCPLATLVHTDATTCELVAAFFSEATGNRVAVRCQRNDTVVCGFEVE